MTKRMWKILSLGLLTALMMTQFIPTTAQDSITATFRDFGVDEVRLTGLNSAATVTFLYQSNWYIENDIVVDLNYSASPVLNASLSAVTVFARAGDDDWSQVTSFRPVVDGGVHTTTLVISRSIIVPDVDILELAFEANLPMDGLDCGPVNNHSQWLLIHGDSRITLRPSLDTTPPDLVSVGDAVFVQNALTDPTPVAVVLPDEPDSVALTAAANVIGRLGLSAGTEHYPVSVYLASQVTEAVKQQSNLVVVGTAVENDLIDELAGVLPAPIRAFQYFDQAGIVIPRTHGVVQLFSSPWNPANHVLLISASGPEGLALAGQAFSDGNTVALMNGSFEIVDSLAQSPVLTLHLPWSEPVTTFAALGFSDRNFDGMDMNSMIFTVPRPPGLILNEGKIALHMAFSKSLVDTGAYFDVYVNNIFMGTIETAGARDLWVEFPLPANQLNQTPDGRRPRSWRFELQLATDISTTSGCEQQVNSWTKIYADSYFTTTNVLGDLPDLQLFPYPFVTPQQDTNEPTPIVIVVPNNPTPEELQVAFGAATTVGAFSRDRFDLSLVTNDELSRDKRNNAHLIVVGTVERQPLIDELTDNQFYEIGSGVYQSLDKNAVGFVHQITSPWNEERVVMFLYANSKEGLVEAGKALYLANPLVEQPGSAALVRIDGDDPPVIIYRELPFDINPAQPTATPEATAAVTETPPPPVVVTATPAATEVLPTTTPTFISPFAVTPTLVEPTTVGSLPVTPQATPTEIAQLAPFPAAEESSEPEERSRGMIPVAIIGFLLATTAAAGGYTWFRS